MISKTVGRLTACIINFPLKVMKLKNAIVLENSTLIVCKNSVKIGIFTY